MKNKIIIASIILAGFTTTATAQQQAEMKLWSDRPADFFEESFPIGNGKLGGLIYGAPDDDVMYLNDITLWTGSPVDRAEGGDAYKWIPEIRKALFNEDYARADSLQLHVQGHNSQFYQPLATMHIIDLNEGATSGYRRELSLDSAVARVTYEKGGTHFTREYFASNPDKVVAVRISADKAQALNLRVLLTAQTPHNVKASAKQLTLMGHAMGDPKSTIHYCSNLLVSSDGMISPSDSTLLINKATTATLYFVNETSFNGFDKHPVNEGAPYIENVADDAWHLVNYTYDELRQRHIDDYKQYFDRVKLRLSPALTKGRGVPAVTTEQLLRDYNDKPHTDTSGWDYLETLYFQYGRYLLISSSRTPSVPANLQGLWAPALWSPWRGNYTMNINLEENYWPAFVCNLAEMAEPLDGFITALSETGKYTAKHYYGIEYGWCASHNSDIWAMTNPVGEKRENPMWANWNLGGAWLVNTLWERYLFTQDKNYLRNTAYPLMKGAAEFCLEWLVENPKEPGELITAPSTSPENEYITDNGYHGVTCYGGTADLAIIRELLTNTITAHHILEKHSFSKKIDIGIVDCCLPQQIALNRLHPYTIGKDGDLNEWYYDWNDRDPKHRHQSHLIGLYPGNHIIHQLSVKSQLLDACERTLVQKGDETTGWSTGWRINLWARLKNGEKAYQIYRKLLTAVAPERGGNPNYINGGGTYPNLFDAHPPFQIDGNFGGTAGVCEMLIQSTPNTIMLLPACPEKWNEGEVSGLCARGGFEVAMKWKDGQVTEAALSSKTGGETTLCYNGKQKKVKVKAGKTVKVKL